MQTLKILDGRRNGRWSRVKFRQNYEGQNYEEPSAPIDVENGPVNSLAATEGKLFTE